MAIAFARDVAAETVVATGGGSETWTAAGSPYHVDVQVAFENLTVEAGTIVYLPPTSGTFITVTELFVVNGTASAPVVFQEAGGGTANDANSGAVAANTFDVTGAVFRFTYFALTGGSTSTISRVTDSVFEANNWAIQTRGNVVVDRVAFVRNNTAIYGLSGISDVTLSNSTVLGGNGLVFLSSTGTVSVTSSTFVNSTCPIAAGPSSTLQNSIVSGGAFVAQSDAVAVSHSILWQVANTSYPALGEGVLREDPELISDTDLRVRPTSPAIDSASPAGAPDHDFLGAPRPMGNGFDMGAYEFSPDDAGGAGGESGDGPGGAAGASGEAGEGGLGGIGGGGSGGAGGTGALGGASTGGAAGSASGTAGASTSGGAGGTSEPTGGADAGDGKSKQTSKTTGCGCRTPHSAPANGAIFALGLAALGAFAARRGNPNARSRSLRAR